MYCVIFNYPRRAVCISRGSGIETFVFRSGRVLLETIDRVPAWVEAGRVLVSSFHSPLEQQVLRSLLRREGRAVKVLVHGMTEYRPSTEECEPLKTGRLAVETVMPHVAGRSPLATLVPSDC